MRVAALWLRFTPSGLYVRAVSQDPSVARMMGINADRLRLLVTSLSTAFAGVAGCCGPYLSIDPGMDVTMIVNCLIIVVIGGTGSIGGATSRRCCSAWCRSRDPCSCRASPRWFPTSC